MSVWLVYHDSGVGQAVSHVLGSSGQQESPHAARLTHAPRRNGGTDVLHRVVDTQAGRD